MYKLIFTLVTVFSSAVMALDCNKLSGDFVKLCEQNEIIIKKIDKLASSDSSSKLQIGNYKKISGGCLDTASVILSSSKKIKIDYGNGKYITTYTCNDGICDDDNSSEELSYSNSDACSANSCIFELN